MLEILDPLNTGSFLSSFLIVAICSATSNRILRMGSVIIGLIVGSIIAAVMGMTDFSQLSSIPALSTYRSPLSLAWILIGLRSFPLRSLVVLNR
jgi:xanthine/uracil permease